MVYSEVSEIAQKRINAIANAVATMDRATIKEGLRLGKRIGREYAKELAFTGDVSNTFSARRQFAIQEASLWLASNSSESFMERKFDQTMNDAMDPFFETPLSVTLMKWIKFPPMSRKRSCRFFLRIQDFWRLTTVWW